MKNKLIIRLLCLLLVASSYQLQAQTPDPSVDSAMVTIAPTALGETTNSISFHFGNAAASGTLGLFPPTTMSVQLSDMNVNGAFNPANVTGPMAASFNWTYNAVANMITGTLIAPVPAGTNGLIHITGFIVNDTSSASAPQAGFNVNVNAAGSNNASTGNDFVSFFTYTQGFPVDYDVEPDMNVTLVNVSVPGDVNTNDGVSVGTTYGTPMPESGNPPGGVISMNPDGTYTFSSPNPGEYNYEVPVCPPGITGGCTTTLLTITVNDPNIANEPPTANPDVASTLQNMPITVDVISNDACNNSPTCALGNPTIVSNPSNGTIVVDPTGTVTYTPNTNFVGVDTAYYSVCDNQSPVQCDTEMVLLTVYPTASPNTTEGNDDYALTDNTTPVNGNVLDNDTDPEGDTQTVTPQNVTTPEGNLVLNANGSYTFTPNAGANGPVSIPYAVCDNGTPSACDSATLTILIEAEPLTTEPDANATIVDVPVNGDVHTNDDVPAGTTYGTPVADAGNPTGATITMNPDGTYTFSSPNPGEYDYEVPVCPPGVSVGCPTELLTITVHDPLDSLAPPTANPDVATTLQNTPVTVDVTSNDACNNGAACMLGNPTIVSGPGNGTVVVDPTGTITYTPNTDYVGTDSFIYSVCDNGTPSQCDTEIVVFTVNPTGSPNSTEANDDFAVTDNNTPVSANVLDNDSDPESNTQTVTPQTVTTPEGTLVLNSNGNYTFTPSAGASGTFTTVYTVCDNGTPSACDSATLTILINDQSPDLTPIIAITPGITNGIQTVETVVDVYNITGEPTTGSTISVFVSKDSRYTLSFNPTATTVAGRSVSNASWTLDASSNPAFYIFTTNNVMNGLSGLNFGYEFNFDPQSSDGSTTITSTILSGSGGEKNGTNNNDNTTLTYFIN